MERWGIYLVVATIMALGVYFIANVSARAVHLNSDGRTSEVDRYRCHLIGTVAAIYVFAVAMVLRFASGPLWVWIACGSIALVVLWEYRNDYAYMGASLAMLFTIVWWGYNTIPTRQVTDASGKLLSEVPEVFPAVLLIVVGVIAFIAIIIDCTLLNPNVGRREAT